MREQHFSPLFSSSSLLSCAFLVLSSSSSRGARRLDGADGDEGGRARARDQRPRQPTFNDRFGNTNTRESMLLDADGGGKRRPTTGRDLQFRWCLRVVKTSVERGRSNVFWKATDRVSLLNSLSLSSESDLKRTVVMRRERNANRSCR